MPVITVSRQHGSLGDDIAADVARRLSLELVDAAAIDEVAHRLGVQAPSPRETDEREGTIVSELVRTMRRLYPATVTTQSEELHSTDESAHLQMIRQVIWEAARNNACVIVGRGAAFVLERNPDVLHVLFTAPLDVRAERVVAAEGLGLQAALQRVKQVDANRTRYLRHFYGVQWMDPDHYDLVVNTGSIPPTTATEVICAAVVPTHGAPHGTVPAK